MARRRPSVCAIFVIFFLSLSPSRAGDSTSLIARKLNGAIKSKPAPALAVLTFPYSRNRLSSGSHLVSERMLTYLVQNGATIIERRLLSQLLEERRLWQTGLMDESSIKNMGKVLGVDAVVTGFLTDLSETATEVLVRVVKVDTGEVIASASGVVQRLWSDPPHLPLIAQPRSAVPTTFIPSDAMITEPPKSSGSPMQRRLPNERRRYYPAPVPVLVPSSNQPAKGRPLQ